MHFETVKVLRKIFSIGLIGLNRWAYAVWSSSPGSIDRGKIKGIYLDRRSPVIMADNSI
jgi:hypothetical protein